jgi:hypothetical protein
MNEKEWYAEFEKIKKLVAKSEEGRIGTINNKKQELVRERDKLIEGANGVQRRIDVINNILVFNVV